MKTDKEIISEIIEAGYKGIEELKRVAAEVIKIEDLEPEKMRQAASAKKLAVSDAFDILQIINDKKTLLEDGDKQNAGESKTESQKTPIGIEDRVR